MRLKTLAVALFIFLCVYILILAIHGVAFWIASVAREERYKPYDMPRGFKEKGLKQSEYECLPCTIDNEDPAQIEVKANRRLKYETVISEYINKVNPRLEDYYVSELTDAIIHESLVAQYDPLLTTAIIKHESTFRNTCVGAAGEKGLMQVHPCHFKRFTRSRLFEIRYNIYAGLQVLKGHHKSAGNLNRALTGYTGGRSGRYNNTWHTLKMELNKL